MSESSAAPQQAESSTSASETRPAGKYRYYVLGVLTLGYALSVVDRGLISVVLSDIKAEFALSDTQLGLLGGTAFALFYASLGIPIARLADRHNRKKIFAAAISFWSAATALCGVAVGFWTLFLGRVGVGIGEAGGTPPSHSMIADYFTKSELGRALGIYSMGAILGVLGGHVLGSYLVETYNWRVTFIVVGLPGVILGALVYYTVREPKRGATLPLGEEITPAAPLGETIKSLRSNKIYLGALGGHTFALVTTYAMFVWIYPLVERSFDMSKTEIGSFTALALVFGAMPAMLLGGMLSDFMIKRNPKWMAWLPAIWVGIAMPFYYGMLFAQSFTMLIVLYGVFMFTLNMHHAAAFALVQTYSKPSERATAVAIILFFVNIFGYAILPVVAGFLSDTVYAAAGDRSIRLGLATIGAVGGLGVFSFLFAAKHIPEKRDG